MFSLGEERSNVLKRQHMDNLQMQQRWVRRNGTKCIRPFHSELAFVGIQVLVQLPAPGKVIGLPIGTFTRKCTIGLHLLRLRSQCKFIPIERQ